MACACASERLPVVRRAPPPHLPPFSCPKMGSRIQAVEIPRITRATSNLSQHWAGRRTLGDR
eukprot:5253536-Alexandrium_andersonii.AAC.1